VWSIDAAHRNHEAHQCPNKLTAASDQRLDAHGVTTTRPRDCLFDAP
jgi:hypothetical protein